MTGAFCLMASSCTDDFPYQIGDIPEGEGQLSATLTFTPAAVSELGVTRTPGNALNDINSLCVLVYSQSGKLIKPYSFTSDKLTITDYFVDTDKDFVNEGNRPHAAQDTTKRATVTLKDLPYGIYKIYAVANMNNLLNEYAEEIENEATLKTIPLTWSFDPDKPNNQMFGYFTTTDNMQSKGFDAPHISFVKPNTEIHAWLKRAASKVTIAFDPSGLKQGVSIYIKNVTIRDIPKQCYLGAENTPDNSNQLWNHLETPFDAPELNKQSEFEPYTRLEYDSDGIITDPDKHTGTAKTDGFVLQNVSRTAIPENAHTPWAQALFFYENNQQPYYNNATEGKGEEEKKKYDKRQESDVVGDPIRDDDGDKDYKDRIPYGTYIEVEAYYISRNAEQVGEGAIKYRFMLGKNVTNDYNAERNHHFKLTLGFNRWANNPDWHIDYEQPTPGIQVQPTFRVSYLYHQKSVLPIRILGKCKKLTVKIVENNWAPYDSTSTNQWKVPPTVVPSNPATYQFEWNLAAFLNPEYMVGNKPRTEFGFLALHLPDITQTTIITGEYGKTQNDALIAHYEEYQEGIRTFDENDLTPITDENGDLRYDEEGEVMSKTESSEDKHASENDKYQVIPVMDDNGNKVDNEVTLLLPVWTRAKSLIGTSGFSGNNPYEGFERKAKLEIKAEYDDNTIITEYVDVLQVKRIVNPKGVWRAHDRTEPFYVTLLESENSNDRSNFKPFESEGEWTAYIEGKTNAAGFSLSKSPDTDGYTTYSTKNGTEIHGYTGSQIKFTINFGAAVGENESECAIVKILYHGNQCLHKILVRKGYNNPIKIGNYSWSSFSLYQATRVSGTAANNNEVFNAVLTKNPLMLGSMFRRGRQDKGIFVSNNMQEDLGPFMPPGNRAFEIGKGTPNNWAKETWIQIGYRDDRDVTSTSTTDGREKGSPNYTLGKFTADGRTYKVPTCEQFQDLTNHCELGFGVFYGSAATEPATTADEAYGLIDPYNEGLFNSKMGMRGVIAYEKENGNQIFFPMGKYGTGRRNNFVMSGVNAGVLRYGDVDYLLTIFGVQGDTYGNLNNNLYRPIPYNLKVQSGNVYWIDTYKAAGDYRTVDGQNYHLTYSCLGWDMNYFNFDFNPYTSNNYRDACPIKLVLVE